MSAVKNSTNMKEILPLILIILLLHTSTGDSTDNRRYNALKFGQTANDYILYQPDMTPFETGFTVCSWIRKLWNQAHPTWFSYAVSGQPYEIQIGDDGFETLIFGDDTDLTSLYTVSHGTWFHNCMGWDSASQTRNVYINGVLVDSKATPAGRTVGLGGYLVLGNEQHGPGTGMDGNDIFGGEMYKMNVFSKKLTNAEIKEMAADRCSEVEEQYGEERAIRWEDVLLERRTGTVTEIKGGCEITLLRAKLIQTEIKLTDTLGKLDETNKELDETTDELNEISKELNETTEQLSRTTAELTETQAELKQVKENPDCPLNSTVTSHWDLLYSDEFFGEILTANNLELLSKTTTKLGYFEGVRITEKIIQFFKNDQCPK